MLVERCGLTPSTPTLEVGPGAGQATAALLALGAPLIAVEPDEALARHLAGRFGERVDVRNAPFEEVEIAPCSVSLAGERDRLAMGRATTRALCYRPGAAADGLVVDVVDDLSRPRGTRRPLPGADPDLSSSPYLQRLEQMQVCGSSIAEPASYRIRRRAATTVFGQTALRGLECLAPEPVPQRFTRR